MRFDCPAHVFDGVAVVSGHTKGPWRLTFSGRGRPVIQREGCPALFVETDQYGKGGTFDPDALRELSDARLIAASPDMLEALQAIEAAMSARTSDWPHFALAQLDKVRAAIKKATT